MKFPIPDDWDGTSWCRFSICWPDSEKWRGLLRGFITLPQRGRTWDERSGSILSVQDIGKEITAANLPLKGVLMACDDNGLQAIADAINNLALAQSGSTSSSCNCLGDNIQVQTNITLPDGSQWPIFGSEPIPELPPSGFPSNYPDLPSYEADKCRIATMLVNDFIASLRRMGQQNWLIGVIGAAVIVACLVGLITVPPAAIPILLLALTGNIGITAALLALADAIEDDKENWICYLYEGDNVNAVTGTISNALDALITALGVTSVIGRALKIIALVLLNSDTLGALFSGRAKDVYPDADCSSCNEECEAFFQNMENGGFMAQKLNDTDFRAVFNTPNNRWELLMAVNHDPDDHTSFNNWTGPMMVIGYETLSGTISGIPVPPSPVRFVDQANNVIGGGSSPQEPHCCAGVIMVSDNQFTVRFFCVSGCP